MLFSLVFISLFTLALSDIKFLLLHNNDLFSRFRPVNVRMGYCEKDTSPDCYGGFARIKFAADYEKQEAALKGRHTIFLNAGDTYEGTAYFTFYRWKIVTKMMSMLGFDVICLGDHEFNDGIPGLVPYINTVSVPIVCSNLNTSLVPSMQNLPNLTPSYVLDVNGTKVGVIGYITRYTKVKIIHNPTSDCSVQENLNMILSNVGNLTFLDECMCVRAEAKRLISEGVKILIALGHDGYERNLKIAREVAEIDVLVGGNTLPFLYSGTPPSIEKPGGPYPTVVTQASGKKVPVVQAYYGGKYLGYLEMDFDDDGNLVSWAGQPILLSGDWRQNERVSEALEPYEEIVSPEVTVIVGYSEIDLDNDNCTFEECNIGNLITDSYVDYVVNNYHAQKGWTLAAVSVIPSAGIRSSITTDVDVYKNGSIALNDVIRAVPWGKDVVIINVNGSVLWEALEWSVSNMKMAWFTGTFLQVAGLEVVYNLNKTAGSRVDSVTVKCADCEVPEYLPLEFNKTYGVVLPKFLADGGNNYTMFKGYSSIVLADVDYEIVAKHLETHTPTYTAIYPGRIKIIETPPPAVSSTPRPKKKIYRSKTISSRYSDYVYDYDYYQDS